MKNWLLTYVLLSYCSFALSQVPTAQFSAGSMVVCVGQNVQFTDLSTSNGSPINVWTYNFGDGTSSNSQNPSHVYSLPGTYTVNLVVTAANGQADAEVKTSYITVNPLPVPDFTTSTNGCSLPVGVSFTNTSSGGVSFEWNFGNGQASNQQNPAVVNYSTAGTYAVTLISTNSYGCRDTTVQNIVISSFQASIDAPLIACVGSPVTINDISTVGVDQWSWSFTGATPSSSIVQNNIVTFSSPGDFTVTLSAQNTIAGCSDNASVTIQVLPLPVPDLVADVTGGCAPLNVSFSSTGDPGASYLWDFGDGQTSVLENPTHTYTSDGAFTVTLSVTDASGCTGVYSIADYINAQAPTGDILADTNSGCAPLTVQLSSNVTSPLDPIISWVWDLGDGTIFNGENPPSHVYDVGSYDVSLTVTTAGGCTAVISEPDFIAAGQIDLVDFSWDIPQACVNVPIQFTDLSVISVPHDPSEVEYFWEFGDGGTSTLPDPLYSYSNDTGYFDVQLVVDLRGCRDTMIYPNAIYILAPVSIFQPSQTLFCNPAGFPISVNFTDNSIIGILSDDADMTWDWGDGTPNTFLDDPDFDDADQGSTSHDYTNYGSYTIEQLIHNYTTGCVDSSTATVNITQTIASLVTDVDSVCLGLPVTFSSTSASTDAFGTFAWETGDGGLINGSQVPYVYSASGNYTVSLTATNVLGCADSVDFSFVTVLDRPLANITASDVSGCIPLNVTFGNTSVTQGNGVPLESFIFQFPDDGTTTSTADLTTTVVHTFNSVGTYNVSLTATDEFGCVSDPALIAISITVPTSSFDVENVVCNGQTVNAMNTSAGVAPLTYEWYLDGLPVATTDNYSVTFNEPDDPTQNQISHELLLVTTDANGCTDTSAQIIQVSTPHADLTYVLDGAETNAAGEFVCPPVFVDFTDASSSFGAITAYAWTFGDGNASTLQSPSNTYIFAGTYSATMSITNEYGCTSDTALIDFLTIYGPSADPSWTESLSSCGLTVNLDVGPTQNVTGILWNLDDGTSISGGNTLTHLYDQIGTYNPTVTVNDDNNCEIVYPLGPFILDQPLLTVTLEGDSIRCFGDADGNVTGVVSGGLAPYIVTLDQSGSTQTVLVDGGSFDFSGLSGQTSGGFNQYSVTVSDAGANLCSITSSLVEIYEPNDPINVVLVSNSNVLCFGEATGEINASVSGGTAPYTYEWSGPSGYVSVNEDINALIAGSYSLVVTDANGSAGGCAANLTVAISQPAQGVTILLDNANYQSCLSATGSLSVSVSGGVPAYTYSWTGPSGYTSADEDINNLAAGDYTLIVTDNSGGQCTGQLDISLSEPNAPVVTAVVTSDYNGQDISCFQAADGIVTAQITGGAAPVVCVWSDEFGNPLDTANTMDSLNIGTYIVIATDQYGCSDTSSILVTEPAPLVVDINSMFDYNGFEISCYQLADGGIELTVNGGTPQYSFNWTDSTSMAISVIEDPTGLQAGTYYVEIEDLNGCSIDTLITLSQPPPLNGDIIITADYNGQNVSCYQASDGAVSANVNGGVPSYTYVWTDETGAVIGSGTDQTAITAGQYTWVATDFNGCAFTQSIILSEPTPVVVDPQILSFYFGAAVSCEYNADGMVSAEASGGVPGYTYSWNTSPVQSGAVASGLAAGTYTVTATDLNGCTGTATVILNANPSPQPVLPPPVQGCIGSSILIDAVPGNWNYCSWTFSDGQQFTECGPFVASFDTTGCLAVQLTTISPEGCMGFASAPNFACIQPNPTAYFYAESFEVTNVVPGTNLINTSVGATSYYWYYSDVTYYDTTLNVYHEFVPSDPNQVNTFEVVLYAVSEFGCIDSTNRTITMIPVVLVYVPNAFTPDGDGFNNTFYPVISGAYSELGYEFLIFNRWGELIFESEVVGEGWDGSYRGNKCQDGVYTWKLKVGHTYDYEIEEFVGHVSLLRGGEN